MLPNPAAPGPAAAPEPLPADAIQLPPEPVTLPIGPATGSEYVTAESPVLSYAPPTAFRHSVGTLTYTSAGLVMLFLFLLGGDFALAMRERAIPQLTILMLGRFHASNLTVSLLISFIPPAVSLLFVPVISFKSDRLRTRWGRRIPYLLLTTPVAAACMAALAFAEDFGHVVARGHAHGWSADTWALIYFTVFWTAFECAGLTTLAIVAGLVNDVVPRPLLGRFYGFFRAISLGAGVLFNKLLFGHADAHYRAIMVGIAALFGVGFTVMCLTVREGEYPPPEAVAPDALAAGRRLSAVATYLRQSFRERYYWWVFASITFGAVTFLPINNFSQQYSEQFYPTKAIAHIHIAHLFAVTYEISLALALPIGWLVDRLSALYVATGCVLAYAVVTLVAGVAVHGPASFGTALILHGVLSGCYFTAAASLPLALLPRAKFGQFASAAGIVQSLTTMVTGPAMGLVLDLSGSNYRLTYYGGGGLALAGAACMIIVIAYRRPPELA